MGQSISTITISNTTAQVVGARGLGFRLEPLANAETGNPVDMRVSVRLNRNDALVYPLTDDAPRYFSEVFEVLEIIGGTLGDRWLLTVYEGQADGLGSPARVLPVALLLAQKASFTAAEAANNQAFYLPSANGRTVNVYGGGARPAPFDLTRLSGIVVLAKNNALSDPTKVGDTVGLLITVELVAGPNADDEAIGGFSMTLPQDQTGAFIIGPSSGADVPPDDLNQLTVVPQRWPWVRLAYAFQHSAPGAVAQATNTSFIRAVALK